MSQDLQNQINQLQQQLQASKSDAFDIVVGKEKIIVQLDTSNKSLGDLLTAAGEALGLKAPEMYQAGVLIGKIKSLTEEVAKAKPKPKADKKTKA